MDKRFFLALFLSLIAIAISQLLFPTVKLRSSGRAADSTSGGKTTASSTQSTATRLPQSQAPETAVSQTRAVTATMAGPTGTAVEMTTVSTPKAIFKSINVSTAPVSIVIRDYTNRSARGGLVDLGDTG